MILGTVVGNTAAKKLSPEIVQRSALRNARKGMWVVFGDRVGILADLNGSDVAHVMLVDHDGADLFAGFMPAAQLKQATFDEIPLNRRPSEDLARRLGYL